jgi:protein transport protein SEC61 subunit gamma-like protein
MDQNEESQNQNAQPQEHHAQEQPKHEEKRFEQPRKPGMFSKLKDTLVNYRRVIDVSRKPDKEEFMSAAKITGAGILVIGLIGFAIFLAYYFISTGVGMA